jgi:hypothetical protein
MKIRPRAEGCFGSVGGFAYKHASSSKERRIENDMTKVEHATEDDVEAVAAAIELVNQHSSEHYARAAIHALEQRGWRPS